MSVYNDASFVAAAVQSILDQTERRFEFLIMDDGSTDRTGEILDEFAAADDRIKVFHQANRGTIASVNTLYDRVATPLIARMDGDDIALPNRFAVQLAFMIANPGIAAVGSNTHDMDERGVVTPCELSYPLEPDEIAAALKTRNVICQPSIMIRTEAVHAVGGYHAMYRHCEDYDLWLRISERYAMANIAEKLLIYRRSAGQVSEKNRFTQAYGSVLAQIAHSERLAGRPDPFAGRVEYPTASELEDIFPGSPLIAQIRERVIDSVKYSRVGLNDGGIAMMKAHLRETGDKADFWRTTGRMVKMGMIPQALSLSLDLLRT
ncbi:glycosyltransferase [Blastomonas sp.]|uniref:glycosyltransferase n=1 Tax=Blastomonas sp. TaxID=1909299 RepID=UPI00391DACA4